MSYGVQLVFSDGEIDVQEEMFETEQEAADYGESLCGAYYSGMETLNMSNPGDYPEDDVAVSYETFECDDE